MGKDTVVTNLKINTEEYTEYGDVDSSDEWDRPDSWTDRTITGAEIVDEKGYKDIPVPFEVKSGDKVYLLYVEYSTGDSFGYDTNYGIHYVGIFADKKLAYKNLENIRHANRRKESGFNKHAEDFEIVHQNGTVENYKGYGIPWYGYFEDMYSSDVVELEVS